MALAAIAVGARANDDCAAAARMPAGTSYGLGNRAGLERMIGQMVMLGFKGRAPGQDGVDETRDMIRNGEIGGVLLLGRNLGTREEVRTLTAFLSPADATLPPLIAVDQEGGRVQRLSFRNGFPPIPGARDVARHDIAEAERIYEGVARDLADVGVNVNFGPVVDLDVNPANQVIGRAGRSYGRDPARVADFARAFVDAHRRNGILTSLKHFPGHGSSFADSHHGFVDISRTWSANELQPFRDLVAEGRADMVMSAHLTHAGLAGDEGVPATLSRSVIQGLLRDEIAYSGVVVTDDLDMGAILDHYRLDETILKAIEAGNDILLFSGTKRDTKPLPGIVRTTVCRAIVDGRLSRDRIAESFDRILRLKQTRLGS